MSYHRHHHFLAIIINYKTSPSPFPISKTISCLLLHYITSFPLHYIPSHLLFSPFFFPHFAISSSFPFFVSPFPFLIFTYILFFPFFLSFTFPYFLFSLLLPFIFLDILTDVCTFFFFSQAVIHNWNSLTAGTVSARTINFKNRSDRYFVETRVSWAILVRTCRSGKVC